MSARSVAILVERRCAVFWSVENSVVILRSRYSVGISEGIAFYGVRVLISVIDLWDVQVVLILLREPPDRLSVTSQLVAPSSRLECQVSE